MLATSLSPKKITHEDKERKVTAVRSSAFADCTYLTSVTLPSAVTSIGDYAFDSCEGIKRVVMPGVKTIGHWSFRNCYELESLDFSEKLTSIGNYCFDKNLKITEVSLPASMTNIGGYAFEGPQLSNPMADEVSGADIAGRILFAGHGTDIRLRLPGVGIYFVTAGARVHKVLAR